jgi:hypothetical protein
MGQQRPKPRNGMSDCSGSNPPIRDPVGGEGKAGPKSPHGVFRGSLPQPVDADLAPRWKGSASETTMTTKHSSPPANVYPGIEDA